MKALYNWILNGHGRGKRYLFALAMMFASMGSFVIYFSWNNFVKTPSVEAFIAQIPELTFQNGRLIKPTDTYKDIIWSVPNSPVEYHLIIDTQNTESDFKNLPQNVLYLRTKDAYLINNGNIFVQPLDNMPDLTLSPQNLIQIIKNGSLRFSWILFFTLTFTLFVVFYFWSLFFALMSYILTFGSLQKYTFPVRRRLSVVSLIAGYLIFIPFSFLGLYLSSFAFFFTVLIVMSFILLKLPKSFLFAVDKN